ncbi:MAG: aldolase catalytic domain-containing protein [Eubacteriales bacterium]|nr:aldolase catalytic domain-containing protein [Eubacteriales bacterium]
MNNNDLKLLDCTLRDGGYVNDWKWGHEVARNIIHALTQANVDVVEVGFLRNVDTYDPDITVCNHIEELNKLLPAETGSTMYSAMAMRSNYDINKLSPYCGSGIEMIRITAHDYDIADGMDFARAVKAKGYKLSINPINIMGYSDERILWILKQVNDIHPYQFSIVDTFGSMKRRDLDRIVSLVDNNLDKDIRVSLHLHENMSLSCCLAQNFIDRHLNRPVAVDASLMGMGRIPGNLPIELIADYLNDYTDKAYDIDYMMDAIQDYIAPIKGETKWGYTPAYFLSAKFNLHRNYAEHYLEKGDLTNRDINHILSRFDRSKTTAFDKEYADKLYNEYKENHIDDSIARLELENKLQGETVLVIAPGSSINLYESKIKQFIEAEDPVVISVNFCPSNIKVDYAFFSNNKRYDQVADYNCKVILTSNMENCNTGDYLIDYNSVSGAFNQGCNSLIMVLKLLKQSNACRIVAAGADGYEIGKNNYFTGAFRSGTSHGNAFNIAVTDAIKALGVKVEFLTPSAYNMNSDIDIQG